MTTVIDVDSRPTGDDPFEGADDSFDAPRRRWYHRILSPIREHTTAFVIFGGVLAFFVIYFAPTIFITVHSGEVGVLYLRFAGGTQTDRVLGEGMKVIAPWDRLFIYNVRVQEVKHEMNAITDEGLKVKLDLSIRYHPEVELVGLLQQQVGPNYRDQIVIPEVESAVRTLVGASSMTQVYTLQRSVMQTVINDSLDHLSQKYIRLDQIILREVTLPDVVRAQVENKMTQQELAESYQFKLEVARREAERLQIEANGQKAYNDTVNPSLTPNILRWQGIEATRTLATSPNSKMIIIGDKNGLPLILGDGSTATTPQGK